MRTLLRSAVVRAAAIVAIAIAGTGLAAAGSAAPVSATPLTSTQPTCLTDHADYPTDACSITAVTSHSVSMSWTVNPAEAYCVINGPSPCIFSFQLALSMSFQGTPGFQVSGSCPDAANGGVFTSGSADIGLLNGDPLACSATWIWDPTTQYALQAYLSMTGLDGQGDLENPDEYHTFGVNLPPPGPNAAFTSAAGSDPGAFTFTDSSFSVIPHVTITDEKWTSSDGGDGTGPTWDHTFDKDGTYDVTLEVTDSNGNTASVTHPVKVTTAGSGGSSASIEVKEKLSPSHDAGRFDLRVGAKKVKAKAANGDHGIAHMSAGTYLVRQVARTVGLTHYSVAMRCTKNGKQSLSASSTAGSLKVSAGDSVICTFTDTRTTSTHCDVPVLTGKSKGAAQKALAKAHCRLGAVHKAASAGSAPVVTSSSPGAYAVRKKNTKVSIHLAKKKK